ncbi:hypothetical protein NB545_09690 [Vibrio campbellii]|uniref:hypothetical protein n=1 Tax=Vibrio campbellii TaxID=680 RepID=UPI00215CC6DD|nr:hypothetical protein [Vibrio campbellii]MCR9907731.1 hypothetical protein [Vibrio campbellii]
MTFISKVSNQLATFVHPPRRQDVGIVLYGWRQNLPSCVLLKRFAGFAIAHHNKIRESMFGVKLHPTGVQVIHTHAPIT